MTSETLYGRFRATARARPDAPFVHVLAETAQVYGIDAGDLSYGAALAGADHWALRLAGAGYGAGHRVGILLENRPEFLLLLLALNRLGASAVPINPDLRLAELEYLVAHSEMSLAIVLPSRHKDVSQAAKVAADADAAHPIPVVTPEQELPAAPHAAAATPPPPGRDTECALLYTSGTTGRPKGCILSNTYFLHSGDWYASSGGLISLATQGERMLTPLPLFHMNALAVSVSAMITVGGCLILLDRFHPSSWWHSVRESRATIVHYLGVLPAILMQDPDSEDDRRHDVRFGFGAGIDRKLHAPFEARFGFPLIEAWACTETGSGATISAHLDPRKPGTSCFGHPPSDVEIRLVDDAGQDVGDDTPGELLVRHAGAEPAYGFFSGYLKDNAATDEAWAGGWFHTGDIVSRDADGDLHFIDRKKNVIRRAGENIAAVEVETILNRHPDIRMSAAAAAPDDIRGDEVAAFLVMEDGAGDRARAESIVGWALGQMAYYKVPGWLAFADALPLTATQKIQRGEMKALVARTMDAGGFHDMRPLKKRQE